MKRDEAEAEAEAVLSMNCSTAALNEQEMNG